MILRSKRGARRRRTKPARRAVRALLSFVAANVLCHAVFGV